MAYEKKSGKSPSYFEKTFKPAPKERKITNKEFSKLPSERDVKKGDDEEDKYKPQRVDFKKINSDRRNRSEGGVSGYDRRKADDGRKSFGDRKPFNSDRRSNDGERRPYNNDRNREGGERKSYGDRKPFNNDRRSDDGERRPYNNDRNREGGERKSYVDRKPFNSDRRSDDGERRPYNDRKSSTGFSRNSYNDARRDAGGTSNFYDKKKEEWKQKDEAARKEYSQRGGYKGRPENKIEGFNQGKAKPKKFDTPYVNARGDMYQDDSVEFSHNKRNQRLEELEMRGEEQMPLNKYIAHCGVCSRREAAEIVKEGRITVNGKVETSPGYKVQDEDVITLDGKKMIPQENQMYVLLNKPKDFITTSEDPEGRKTVMDLVANACDERIYPVGRLDRNTSGLLLLTNDGDLANKLSHPRYRVKKLYQVNLDKPLSKIHHKEILAGLELEDGVAEVDELEFIDLADLSKIGIQIHSGKNRIVRRIFESLGYEVKQLDRVTYANLTKKNLPRGSWRYLTPTEIKFLKHFNSNA